MNCEFFILQLANFRSNLGLSSSERERGETERYPFAAPHPIDWRPIERERERERADISFYLVDRGQRKWREAF